MAMEIRNNASTSQLKSHTMASSIEELDPIITRLESCASRVAGCGDRLHGVRPQAVEDAEKGPEPSSLLNSLHSRRSRLAKLAEYLEAEVSRVEGGLS